MEAETSAISQGPDGLTYISGTHIRIIDVVRVLKQNEAIREAYPMLTPAQIKTAVNYWIFHAEEIEAEVTKDRERFAAVQKPTGS